MAKMPECAWKVGSCTQHSCCAGERRWLRGKCAYMHLSRYISTNISRVVCVCINQFLNHSCKTQFIVKCAAVAGLRQVILISQLLHAGRASACV